MSSTTKRKKNGPPVADNDKRQTDAPSSDNRNRRRRYFSYVVLLTAILLTVFSGLIDRKLSNQWGLPPEAMAGAERLEAIPEQFGNWKMVRKHEPSKSVVEILECVGYLHRNYVHQKTGELVTVSLILGGAGPTSVHTPEICYSSRDFAIRDERMRVSIGTEGSDPNEFWALTLQSRGLDASLLRVYYAWSFDGRWAAPKSARLAHVGLPYLYMMQLASHLPPGTSLAENDRCRDFLAEFVPMLDRHQFN